MLKLALKFDFKFTERLYLSNVSRNGVVSSSAVYSEAPQILSSFCEGRAQLITASGVIAMEKVRVPKLKVSTKALFREDIYGLKGI